VYLLIFIVDKNLVETDAIVSTVTLRITHGVPQSPHCVKTTSSAKPEIRNAFKGMHKKLAKFGSMFLSYASGRTDGHTHRNASQPVCGRSKNTFS